MPSVLEFMQGLEKSAARNEEALKKGLKKNLKDPDRPEGLSSSEEKEGVKKALKALDK